MYKKIVQKFSHLTFGFWQRLGFHITPVHFYSPIPSTSELANDTWQPQPLPLGIDMKESGQVALLSELTILYQSEYNTLFKNTDSQNTEFGPVDREVLYCMVRRQKPKYIIEVGSGYSTTIMLAALEKNKNEGSEGKLTSVDPYAKSFVKEIKNPIFTLINQEVQKVSLQTFGALGENDILFIDSSHVVKIGSDVQYEFLQILPRLTKGVVIHIHDIFLPAEYPKAWIINQHQFFNEQYLLQAFLSFNSAFEILFAASFMHVMHPQLLEKSFASYNKETIWPGSFWIKRV